MADPAKTYTGHACGRGHTLRWRSTNVCVECQRAWARAKYASDDAHAETRRERVRTRREDHVAYYGDLLTNRRYLALKRMEARHRG